MSRDMKGLAIALLALGFTAVVYASWTGRFGGNPVVYYGALAACLALGLTAKMAEGRVERRRSSALSSQAQGLGFSFDPDGRTLDSQGPWPQPPAGSGMDYLNLLRGALGRRPLVLCDFVYSAGAGKSRRLYRQTLSAVHLGEWVLPRFVMRPEGLTDKVSSFFGDEGGDIDFHDGSKFSGRYFLTGEDRPAVRKLFRDEVLAYFAERPGWLVEGHPSGWLIAFRHDTLLEPYKIKGFLEELERLAQLLAPSAPGPS